MKRILSIFLCLLLTFPFCISAFAAGDGNMDGGGGDMGGGTGQNFWSVGDDGVRVSVIKASNNTRYKTPVDFTHVTYPMNMHFGKKNKIDYRSGSALSPQTTVYQKKIPALNLPTVISSSGSVNIDELKRYFCSEGVLMDISPSLGIPYDKLISGDYKLLIEPIAYFTYNGIKIAATAHEVALYDQRVSGDLRSKLGNLTHKNLPLAIYLEYSDLGFPAWTGSSSSFVSNADILSSLGLGIVRFEEELPEDPNGEIELPDYEYHTDIDVITSFYIDSGEVSPDDNGKVYFTVNGRTQSQSYVVPKDESQLVWFKWRTPKTPQELTATVEVTGGGRAEKSTMTIKVVELVEQTPPDPQPRDKKPSSFAVKPPPKRPDVTRLTWGVWVPRWKPNWVWESDMDYNEETGEWEDNGEYVDKGWWEYDWRSYNASLSADMILKPDERVPTDYKSGNKTYMGSGYGVNTVIEHRYSGSNTTGAQNAIATFPEFGYKTFNRVLERTQLGRFEFKENLYSQVKHRVHYTPLWFPDDAPYEVQVEVIDCYTPAGMLRVSKSVNDLYIYGSVYDDWRWVGH